MPRPDAAAHDNAGGTAGTPANLDGSTTERPEGGVQSQGFFSDDFESGTPGKTPTGWDALVGYTLNGKNPSGSSMAVVDDTRAHSGTKSIHIHGGASAAQISHSVPEGTQRLYMRAFVYLTRAIGRHDPGSSNHDGLFVVRKSPGSTADEVRFGEAKGAVGLNHVPSDDLSPVMAQWGKGAVIPAGEWHCLEVAWIADLPQHQCLASLDGTTIFSVTAPDQWEHKGAGATFLMGKLSHAAFGWHSFSGVETDLWIDDVVLSSSPIGCPR